ncbi:hypothetical protein AAXB25_29245 [Paenibacillus lautus]|uniref:hypothetical protein n=1 Tax=Paenibacillus lautus TaxID=1401 RepID=UPI003D2A6D1D
MKGSICYWCGAKANSMEHVPPKCLFPEEKDVKEITKKNYRDNLIRVTSCDEHNLKKSNLDEYLMVHLSGRVGNYFVAYLNTATKINRIKLRNPKVFKIDRPDVVKIKGKEFPVLWVDIDTGKLAYSFESIARGLYFYEYGDNFIGKCLAITKLFKNSDNPEASKYIDRSFEIIENEKKYWNTEIKGSNPEIFTYQFSKVDGFNCQTLALNFYGGTVVYVILDGMTEEQKKKAEPSLKMIESIFFSD